jgi:phage-related protein
MPSDFKPMLAIGRGAYEIRVRVRSEWRVIFVARFDDAIYVLHLPEKARRMQRGCRVGGGRYKLLNRGMKHNHQVEWQRLADMGFSPEKRRCWECARTSWPAGAYVDKRVDAGRGRRQLSVGPRVQPRPRQMGEVAGWIGDAGRAQDSVGGWLIYDADRVASSRLA